MSEFDLGFVPVECPDIALWAARSKIPSASSNDPHGNGHGIGFQWNAEHGIRVSAIYWTGGGCQMRLSQIKPSGGIVSSHSDNDLISPEPLVRGLGAIVSKGDIRDVTRAEDALQTKFASHTGQFGISYELMDIIPGVDPISFDYSVNDTGLEPSPYGAFFYVPPISANRTAHLRLLLDVYHVCIRQAQLPTEFDRRRLRYRRIVKDGEDTYVIRGGNEIRIQSELFGGCIRDIDVAQITDVKHALRRSD